MWTDTTPIRHARNDRVLPSELTSGVTPLSVMIAHPRKKVRLTPRCHTQKMENDSFQFTSNAAAPKAR